jgi:hypothetical protein
MQSYQHQEGEEVAANFTGNGLTFSFPANRFALSRRQFGARERTA